MANTFSQCYYHFVFSTKNRIDRIDRNIEERVWSYIGGIARKHGIAALQVGGTENHIHSLTGSSATVAPSQIAQWLKGESSHWIRREFGDLKDFGWQDGYGVFTVSKSHVPKVVEYIKNQRIHHQSKSFEDEYMQLLERHGINYDERYVFG